jgi:pimeloyl-ACP methyl ester carboxylesterase
VAAYALSTRVADALAVLDALGIERVHFLGSSWGARFGFALGEHAPERMLSLVPLRQSALRLGSRVTGREGGRGSRRRIRTRRNEGLRADLRIGAGLTLPRTRSNVDAGEERPRLTRGGLAIRRTRGPRLAGPERMDGAVSHLLRRSGRNARRCQEGVRGDPWRQFVTLAGHSHISAFYEADDLLLPHIVELLRGATVPQRADPFRAW